MRHLVFFISLLSLALGRENPFMATNMNENTVEATNIKHEYEAFEKKEINLPNNARVIKSITIDYQTLDGSIEKKKLKVDRRFDWHDPLVLKVKEILPVMPDPIIQKKDLLAKIIKDADKTKKKPTKTIVITESTKSAKPKKRKKEKNLVVLDRSFGKFFRFGTKGKLLRIQTKDKMVRDFSISKPYKLVFDFQTNKTFYTRTLKIDKAPFKSVTFGSHNGYYRVAFLLDGPYPYNLLRQKGDLLVELR